jgi:hypothetical protein
MRKAVDVLDQGVDLPGSFWYSAKRRLLGPPLVNEQREEWTRADRGVVLDFIDVPDRRLTWAAAELVGHEAENPGTQGHRGAAAAQLLTADRSAAARPDRG